MIKQKNDDVAVGASTPPEAQRPLDILRNATSDYHRELEAAIDWMGAFQSYEAYQQLLERFARVVLPLEQAIAQELVSAPPPQFDPTARTRWLESDLTALNSIIGSSAQLPDRVHRWAGSSLAGASRALASSLSFVYIDNVPAAIGAQYVLEGSSLGGQFLARQLRERLQLTPGNGAAYFAAHGAATAGRWKTFRQWANEQLADSQSTQLASEAARLTFVRFGKALAGLVNE